MACELWTTQLDEEVLVENGELCGPRKSLK